MVSVSIDWSRLPGATTALGVALVSAAIALSATYSRKSDDLDVSNFVMGVLATLGLLGTAVAARRVFGDAAARADLVSWPGAAGAAGAGLMLGVLITDDQASVYSGGLVTAALCVAGYLLTRDWPFVAIAVAALAALYAQAFTDLVDTGGKQDNQFMVIGAGILVFVVLATAIGWLLPETRTLSAMVVGAGALVAMYFLLETLMLFSRYGFSFGDSSGDGADFRGRFSQRPFENDVYAVLAYCAVLVVLWQICALATGHVGFRILAIALTVVALPMATLALLTRHPTWWEVGACALGALALVGAGDRLARRGRTAPSPAAP
jgi:hypothetical protein